MARLEHIERAYNRGLVKKSIDKTRPLRLLNLSLGLGQPEEELPAIAARELGVAASHIANLRVARKALDARRRRDHEPHFVVHVDFELDGAASSARLRRALRSGRVVEAPEYVPFTVESVHPSLRGRHAAVVGAGPAGLFAALVLARNGLSVTLVDRGSPVEKRGRELSNFHSSREPNRESNLLFGEGGAGTYSDGKIYTRVDHPLEVTVLEELVECGAPDAIVYDSLAHIGTDQLHRILPRLRAKLEEAGTRIVWNTRIDRLDVCGDRVRALATTAGEIECDLCVLALGHSARDTWLALAQDGMRFESKPFQLGVRIEHPQELIDRGRWGDEEALHSLGAASYQLTSRASGNSPPSHTFCMCPGGKIVASVNEPGLLCTNGMSNSKHSSRWANAAIVTTFGPREFGEGPFAGVEFQRALEERFFVAGGSDYTAPAQRASDFIARRASSEVGRTSYTFGVRPGRIDRLLPERARAALASGLARFDGLVPGFASERGLLVGLESRSAGPVRAPRDERTARADGFANLIPIGEGAGYAGGIMSAALDGAKTARTVLRVGVQS